MESSTLDVELSHHDMDILGAFGSCLVGMLQRNIQNRLGDREFMHESNGAFNKFLHKQYTSMGFSVIGMNVIEMV